MPVNKTQKMTEPNNKLRKFQRSSNKFHVLRITRRGITMLDELHEALYRSPKFQPSHILHARRHYNTNISTCMSFMWNWIHKQKASTCHSVSSCIAVCIAIFIGGIWIWHVRRFPGNEHYHELRVSTGLPARSNVKTRLSSCLRTKHWKLIGSKVKD